MPSFRSQLVDALTPVLPGSWELVPTQRTVDTLSHPIVQLSQISIRRDPNAPQSSALLTTFTLTVVDPLTDPERAEDNLDDEVLTLIFALDGLGWLRWTDATKVIWQDSHLAYDITIETLTRQDPN